ncbi:MAG: TetR/AcrR family transcriptional regulator [Marinifilaceae bacterium]
MRLKDEQKIEAIYQATLRLNEKLGFVGMTMAKIAKEAGIATGTLYIYFKNKEVLINELYLYLKKRKAKNLLAGWRADKPFKLALKHVVVAHLRNSIENRQESAFLEQYFRSPFIREEVQNQGMELFAPFFEMVEDGKKQMIIKDLDDLLLFAVINGISSEFENLINSGQMELNQENLDLIYSLIWDALKA